MLQKLEKFFKVKEEGSTVKRELLAGVTSFLASAFTIITIPNMILGQEYQNPNLVNAIFIAACFSAVIGTLLKAFYAKIPFIQAPGMGLGAFFSGTVMPAMIVLSGNPELSRLEQYQMALGVVLVAGLIFCLLTISGIREKIIGAVPDNIKAALGPGIGLFITLLGLRFSGIVVNSPGTFVALRNFSDWQPAALGAVLSIVGLLIIVILSMKKIKGAILIGIIFTTLLTYITGHSNLPDTFSLAMGERFNDFWTLSFLQLDFSFFGTGSIGTIIAFIMAFVFVNMLDALGTIYGISKANGMVDKNGKVKRLEQGLTADAIGTAVSGFLGSSTVTTVVSSASGIGEGGRTGLTSLTASALFLLAIFLAPFIALIPNVAIAPALIYVGYLMISNIKEIDFSDITEGFPAFLTVALMPLSFNIAAGIAFGLISYIVIKIFTGKIKEIKITTVLIAALFVLQYIF